MRTLLYTLLLLAASVMAVAQGKPAADTPNPPAPAPAAITKPLLEKRLTELQAARERAVANLNALDGSIFETQHWLAELAKPAESAKEKP